MTREARQEALSLAYVQAVAAAAGVTFSMPGRDMGIDLRLHLIRRDAGRLTEAGVQLDVQVKCTTLAVRGPTTVPFDLKTNNYLTHRDPAAAVPRALILLALPPDESRWVDATEERLHLHGSAYWASLRGLPVRTNRRSVRVHVPRQNLFTPVGLARITGTLDARGEL